MEDIKYKLHKKFDTSDIPEILKPGNKNYDLWRVDADMIIEPVSDAAREAARKHIQESRKPQFTHDTDPKVVFKNVVYSFTVKQRTAHEKIWDKQWDRVAILLCLQDLLEQCVNVN